ncbi:MAG: hypothetical protein ACTHJQ_01445 [Rhizobiaceae bacterium]
MSTAALNEATMWADQLMEAETRHRREKEYTVRERLAEKIGVSASYLFRLQYKTEEMSDVKGSVYRALMVGCQMYGLACSFIENKAEAIEREAQEIEENNAAFQSHRTPVARAETAAPGAEREMK